MTVTNNLGISLPIAVWLLHDDYDYVNLDHYISVTTLMKPLRQIVLAKRIPRGSATPPDVSDFIARSLGNSIHTAMEYAWRNDPQSKLMRMGYPQAVVDRIRVNPEPAELTPDTIAIYLEQRHHRAFEGWTIGGKFDMVTEGIVNDTKTTSAYGWMYGTRDEEHILQGSLYRWIDHAQDHRKITEDFMRVNYIFTDWQKAAAKQKPEYPQKRVEMKEYPLMSLAKTEEWVNWKLAQVKKYLNAPEDQIPECTDEELWRSDAQYKYYADPSKTDGRSTRNFTNLAEAHQYWKVDKGGKGIVITKPGEVKRCGYCDSYDICTQKDQYFS